MKKLIEDYKPHILGLSENNFSANQDQHLIEIPGYNLFLSKTITNPNINLRRIVVYTHQDLIAQT